MGKILPIPTPGQPIDFAYLNAIISSLNELTEQMGSTKSAVVINGSPLVQQPQIIAKQFPVTQTFSAKNVLSSEITIGFDKTFGSTPVVTATFQATDNESNKNISVIITKIDNTSVGVKMVSNHDSKLTGINGSINIIAVGRPA